LPATLTNVMVLRPSHKPLEPVSNMFHVHFDAPKEEMETILVSIYEETGIGLTSYIREVNKTTSNYEVSIGDLYSQLPKVELPKVFILLDEKMKAFKKS
jgi:hypothetical protein